MDQVAFRWTGPSAFGLEIACFEMEAGEKVLLLGESGAGKSTLLSLVCGTLVAARGTITLSGKELGALSFAARDRFRAEHVGIIFQQFNLLPYAPVLDNILLGLAFAPARQARVPHPRQAARQLCSELDLPKEVLTKMASQLSVGQQQRVAAARALIGTPPLIVADEPTSALDTATQETFLARLFDQTAAHNTALLMVSHDARLGSHFDRVLDMGDVATALVGA